MADTNHDMLVSLRKDVEYIKSRIDEIISGHIPKLLQLETRFVEFNKQTECNIKRLWWTVGVLFPSVIVAIIALFTRIG